MTRDGNADGPRIAPAAALRQWALAQRLWFGAAALLLVLPFVPGLDTNFGRSLLSQMGIAAVFAGCRFPCP